MLRFVLIAQNHGTDFLYDADSFDRMLGRGRFAQMDGRKLRDIRSIVESPSNDSIQLGGHSPKANQQLSKNKLSGDTFGR